MEEFVGKPHVYTININDKQEVRKVLKEILENFDKKLVSSVVHYLQKKFQGSYN